MFHEFWTISSNWENEKRETFEKEKKKRVLFKSSDSVTQNDAHVFSTTNTAAGSLTEQKEASGRSPLINTAACDCNVFSPVHTFAVCCLRPRLLLLLLLTFSA